MMVLENMMDLYDKVRWALFLGVWILAFISDAYWLIIIALVIGIWPKPEERHEAFYGTEGIFNRNKPKY